MKDKSAIQSELNSKLSWMRFHRKNGTNLEFWYEKCMSEMNDLSYCLSVA